MLLPSPLLALSGVALASAHLSRRQVVTGRLGDATQNLDPPAGAAYQAIIPKGKFGQISGSIVAVAAGDKGTEFAVNLAGLPTEGGPFLYHIHVNPIPTDDNCTAALAHLDPYIRGEVDPCTASRPETCQVGDLSGKYGKINATTAQRSFTDAYVSLANGQGAFFGNRSFVVHFANTTRIACANFMSISNTLGTGMTGLLPNATNPGVGISTLVPAAVVPGSNNTGNTALATSASGTSPSTTTGPVQVTTSAGTPILSTSNFLILLASLVGAWSCI